MYFYLAGTQEIVGFNGLCEAFPNNYIAPDISDSRLADLGAIRLSETPPPFAAWSQVAYISGKTAQNEAAWSLRPKTPDELAASETLAQIRARKISEAYSMAVQKASILTEGYSASEIATWPSMKSEVANYNATYTATSGLTPVVGPTMQTVVDRKYEACGHAQAKAVIAKALADKLTPMIAYEMAILARRDQIASAVFATADEDAAWAIDTAAGWPAFS